MPYVAEQFANNDQYITFDLPEDFDFIRVIVRHVAAVVQPGSLLTMHFGPEGGPINTNALYMNTGMMSWGGDPNPAWSADPLALGLPQTLDLGCRISLDVGERDHLAANANVDITNFGSLDGQDRSPVYVASGWIGFIGGIAGVSVKPAHLGGGFWFPLDPYGTPFDWNATYLFGGHMNAPGMRVRQLRFSMDGGGSFGRDIAQGYFRVEAYNRGEIAPPPPTPPPGVTYTPIGDMNALGSAFDGVTDKAAGAGAWKVGTGFWIGRTGSEPWPASSVTIYGSNNDGFYFGHPPEPWAQFTAKLYESDGVPANETDGTLVETKTFTDTDAIPSVSFSVPAGDKLSRWVVMTHDQPSHSNYVSAVVFA